MVTICTASLTFNNSTFSPHSVFMCFVWISEQTAIISLYSINWLVFITETTCVYCAVRTVYFYSIDANPCLQSLAIAQAVIRLPVTVVTQILSQAVPSKLCRGQICPFTGFSPSFSVLPCQCHSTNAPYSTSSNAVTKRTNGLNLGTLRKAMFSLKSPNNVTNYFQLLLDGW